MSYTAADMTAPAQNKLRSWRAEAGKSVNEAAAEIGCTRQTWYSWESGQNIPSPDLMAKLVAMTGAAVTANDFYDLPPHDTPAPDSGGVDSDGNRQTTLTTSRKHAA
jgi:DNA-binding XRE family transcriptional regulator